MNAIFPMKYVNITQKWGNGTHTYGYPIDNAGKDSGIEACYAPFDGVIKKIWPNGNTVWLESLQPVEYADGNVDFAVFMATHDNNISDLKVGQIIKQGVVFYHEGTAGQATGNHVHMEFGRGRFTGAGWYKAPNGQWVINNPVKPNELLVLNESNIVIETLGVEFKRENPMYNTKERVKAVYNGYLGQEPGKEAYDFWVGRPCTDLDDAAASQLRDSKNAQIAALEKQLAEQGKPVITQTLKKGIYEVQ